MTVYEKIEAMQAGKENTAPWTVGQQLKDICKRQPQYEQIVLEDLENPDMSLEKCEKQLRAWADEQNRKQKGNCVCVPPDVADGIIRKFYGLGEAEETGADSGAGDILDLEDLLEGL